MIKHSPTALLLLLFTGLLMCLNVSTTSATTTTTTPVNIIHVTDVHGWIYGHRHNETLNTDFGDFYSLLKHMKQNARKNNEEFFACDSGDLIEGTGLSDASTIHGQYIFDVVRNLHDVMTAWTVGNHDLEYASSIDVLRNDFIPYMHGSYLTSNTFYNTSDQPQAWDYLGKPYKVLDTELGHRVLLLGFIFDFVQNAKNTRVVPPADAVHLPEFTEAMNVPGVDVIIVMNHIDPQGQFDQLHAIYSAIRQVHPSTPLVLLTGHAHLLYYTEYDTNCIVIESGCYFQQLGHITFDLVKTPTSTSIANVKHQWINTSLQNMYSLAGVTTSAQFNTSEGNNVKSVIDKDIKILGLDSDVGCSPATFSPYAELTNTHSFYRLWVDTIIPTQIIEGLKINNTPFFISNTATLRYPLYAGEVILDDVFTISPFRDRYSYYSAINGSVLKKLIHELDSSNPDGVMLRMLGEPERDPAPIMDREAWPAFSTQIEVSETRVGSPRLGADGMSLAYDLPAYVYSSIPIDSSKLYDVVAANYDSFAISELLPGNTAMKIPTALTSTTALETFIRTAWPKCTKQ